MTTPRMPHLAPSVSRKTARKALWDAHAALQLVVVGRLKDSDVQIRRRHDRQGAGHDADVAHQPRKLRCVGVPEHTDERRRGQDLPERDHDQRAEQRHGHQVVAARSPRRRSAANSLVRIGTAAMHSA